MRRSWRCMAALLLMIMILVSGGGPEIPPLLVNHGGEGGWGKGKRY